jgi:hypothetical protein
MSSKVISTILNSAHDSKPVPTDVKQGLLVPADRSLGFWIPRDSELAPAFAAHDCRTDGDHAYLSHAARLIALAQLTPERLDATIAEVRTAVSTTEHKPTLDALWEKHQTLQRAKAIAKLLQGGPL